MKSNRILLLILALTAGLIIVKYFYNKPALINGDESVEINGVGLNGQLLSLVALRGSYVLIDFWGSWCGPCRKENPSIARLYNEYKEVEFIDGSGFHVFSVGIEKDSNSWKSAIEKDRLYWSTHIADLTYFDSPIAKSYGVRSIPAKFLIDPVGRIISVNQSPDEIGNILKKRAKKD